MKFIIFFIFLIDFLQCKETVLYNSSFTIKFSEVVELKLNLTELAVESKDSYSPFLKISVISELNENCLKNKNVRFHLN